MSLSLKALRALNDARLARIVAGEPHLTEAEQAEILDRHFQPTRDALKCLYDETADYIRLNNLGDIHHNRSMQMARDVLNEP